MQRASSSLQHPPMSATIWWIMTATCTAAIIAIAHRPNAKHVSMTARSGASPTATEAS